MCGFFNAPFCHLVSKKKFFLRKKNQIGEGGIRREGILQILLADIFFKCFRQHSTFYHIFFFSSLIFFMFHQKRNKNQKTTLNQREKFFWKKNCYIRKNGTDFFMVQHERITVQIIQVIIVCHNRLENLKMFR